jgi:splicing factor, arginine/serine-rich 2
MPMSVSTYDCRNGDSRGFAFVRYKYEDEAQKAVDRLDGRFLFLTSV